MGICRAKSFIAVAVLGAAALSCKAKEQPPEIATAAPACPTCVRADQRGFTPARIELQRGGPGATRTVTFTRTTDETCATAVVFPEIGLKKDLPINTPVSIEVPVDAARTLTFQCGMGMYKSSVVVR